MKRLAWRITWKGIVSIVSETTRGRAISCCCKQAREAGYRACFVDFRAAREPQYDRWAALTRYRCVDEEFIAKDPTVEPGGKE